MPSEFGSDPNCYAAPTSAVAITPHRRLGHKVNRTGFFGGSLSWVVPVLVGHGQRSRRLRTLREGCHRGGGAAAGC